MADEQIGRVKLNVQQSYNDATADGAPVFKPVISNSDMYLNSECLFIEYNDVLRSPLYSLLKLISKIDKLRAVLNLSIFDNYNDLELYEWYINRKHNNFYYDIPLTDITKQPPESFFDEMLTKELLNIPELYETAPILSMSEVVKTLLTTGKSLIKHVIVYNNYDNPNVKKDIAVLFPRLNVEYAAGNILQVLSKIPNNSTFVFSDIMKVQAMVDIEKINFSSILIPAGLRYNYDDKLNLKINLEELSESFTFKYNFFKNVPVVKHDNYTFIRSSEFKEDENNEFNN